MHDRISPDKNLSELERRIANISRKGKVAEASYINGKARVRVSIGDLTTDWLPLVSDRMGPDKKWHPVEVGEQVLILSPNGDLRQAVVIGALDSNANPGPADRADIDRTTYADGGVVEYDRAASRFKVQPPTAGEILLTVGAASLRITNDAITISIGATTHTWSAGAVTLATPDVDWTLGG